MTNKHLVGRRPFYRPTIDTYAIIVVIKNMKLLLLLLTSYLVYECYICIKLFYLAICCIYLVMLYNYGQLLLCYFIVCINCSFWIVSCKQDDDEVLKKTEKFPSLVLQLMYDMFGIKNVQQSDDKMIRVTLDNSTAMLDPFNVVSTV